MKLKQLAVAAACAVGLSTTACLPPSPPAGSITCGGGSGQVTASPAVSSAVQPVTFSLTGPSSTQSCVDGTGAGLTSARVETLTLEFAALGCFVPVGLEGVGSTQIGWSDGTTSVATVTATMGSTFGGTLRGQITSGRFTGKAGSTSFAVVPEEGSCFEGGIARFSMTFGELILAGT